MKAHYLRADDDQLGIECARVTLQRLPHVLKVSLP